MKGIVVMRFPVTGSIKAGDMVVASLEEIKDAVEVCGSAGDAVMMPRIAPLITRKSPKAVIPGWHVAEIYERYPCFDAGDYACEDRYFQNYLFSRIPVTDSRFVEMLQLPVRSNCCMANENIPVEFLPIVYYDGEGNTVAAVWYEP